MLTDVLVLQYLDWNSTELDWNSIEYGANFNATLYTTLDYHTNVQALGTLATATLSANPSFFSLGDAEAPQRV